MALLVVFPVVEADGLFVTLHRVHQTDDQIGRARNVAKLRVFADEAAGDAAKLVLVDVRLGCDQRNKTAHELQIAIDIAFQPGTDNTQLLGDIRTSTLQVNQPVLDFPEYSRRRDNSNGNAHRQDAGEARPRQKVSGSDFGKK